MMLPIIIEDLIGKINDKSTHPEKRQFYFTTLTNIKTSVDKALKDYETERNFKK